MEKSNYIDELVADCRERLKEIPMVRIQHCYRETNKCVDALARKGALMDQNFTIFLIPPPNVVILLNLDLAGTFLIGLLLPLEFSLCIFNQKKIDIMTLKTLETQPSHSPIQTLFSY